jgi:hypothetical protein
MLYNIFKKRGIIMTKKVITTQEGIYKEVSNYLKRYPYTFAWRIKQHSSVICKHLNPDEEVYYVFPAQRNPDSFNVFTTCLVALTNKRILIAQKRVLWGYNITSITPDMFNDFELSKGLIFGKLDIDTVKEVIRLSNLDSKALVEIETNLSEYILEIKPKTDTI